MPIPVSVTEISTVSASRCAPIDTQPPSGLRQHVRRKALAAQDDEVAHHAGEQCHECPDDEGVLHEMKPQQQLQVGQQVPGGRVSHYASWSCAGYVTGSCWPTTTTPPSLVR